MRIHSNVITEDEVREAADHARVTFTRFGEGKSRTHSRFFDVILSGESRRHQNGGPDKAATWDQWGVFLSVLFDRDPNMICGAGKRPVYNGADDFDFQTNLRFSTAPTHWPADAHGDHTFRYSGTPGQQDCTKCSAVKRWTY